MFATFFAWQEEQMNNHMNNPGTRPGTGISPKFTDIIIGRKLAFDLQEDTVLTWNMIN